MKNKKGKLFLGLLIAVVILIALVIGTKRNKPSLEVTREISPTQGNIQIFISTTGTVKPQNRLEVKPPISGRVEEILVNEGEKVKVGQILAWMSSTERAALLDAARSRGEEAVKYWQEVYKPTPLMAPINGEVIVRAVEPGQTVTSGDAIIVLSDRLIVKAHVDETDIGRVKVGQEAIIGLDAYPQIEVSSKVDHISYESRIMNNVTIYEVDILPKRVPGVFRSGMSANVNIIEKKRENVLTIPLEAVKQDREADFVLLSQGTDKKPLRRNIELGISNHWNVEIVSGLQETDRILVKTQNYQPAEEGPERRNPLTPFGRRRRGRRRR